LSRKPKAVSGSGGALFEGAVNSLLGRADDPSLVWHVPRVDILEAVKTVQGIARLALVSRKTVYRLGVAPGSLRALEFVRDRRIKIGRPLVSDGAPLSWRGCPREFLQVVQAIRKLRSGPDAVVHLRDDESRGGRRAANVQHRPGLREITVEERALFAKRGAVSHYAPGSRVTTSQLAGFLGWSRAWFYRWRSGLSAEHRRILDVEMGRPRPPVPPARVVSSGQAPEVLPEEWIDFPFDEISFGRPVG
jgi:hypothetical protein